MRTYAKFGVVWKPIFESAECHVVGDLFYNIVKIGIFDHMVLKLLYILHEFEYKLSTLDKSHFHLIGYRCAQGLAPMYDVYVCDLHVYILWRPMQLYQYDWSEIKAKRKSDGKFKWYQHNWNHLPKNYCMYGCNTGSEHHTIMKLYIWIPTFYFYIIFISILWYKYLVTILSLNISI